MLRLARRRDTLRRHQELVHAQPAHRLLQRRRHLGELRLERQGDAGQVTQRPRGDPPAQLPVLPILRLTSDSPSRCWATSARSRSSFAMNCATTLSLGASPSG
ncbi:MAG: hypothetical protein SGJ01_14485 [Gemmatimonadota bacterium]|nr:hypothetical protein [Gemmatimonadota bacterium]